MRNLFKIIQYLFYLRRDVIPRIDYTSTHKQWKIIFEKYIIPLNDSSEAFLENTTQFIPSTIGNVERFKLNLEKIVFSNLEKINSKFRYYLLRNYEDWVKDPSDPSTPLNVINVLERKFLPLYLNGLKSFNLILFIDCCHLGTWNILKQKIINDFPELMIETEIGYSILPTLTKYARAALFSGKYPKDFTPNIQNFDEFKAFLNLIGKQSSLAYRNMVKKHFNTNCENIFDFTETINSITNPGDNFQISIFNFSDRSSHTFSQSFLKTLITSIYNSKIRPLLELVIRKYNEILILFATDHGSSRCTEIFDWNDPTYNVHWKNSFIKTNPRTFIGSKAPLNFGIINNELICIKSTEALKWGLPDKNLNKDLYYFFADNYYNLKKTPNNKRSLENFGHGGSTMEEFIIPFAIFKKKESTYEEFDRKIEVDLSKEEDETKPGIYTLTIEICNESNKDIIFHEGHLITDTLHLKIILLSDNLIQNSEIITPTIRLPSKYQQNASFYYTYYQDEKLEISETYYF